MPRFRCSNPALRSTLIASCLSWREEQVDGGRVHVPYPAQNNVKIFQNNNKEFDKTSELPDEYDINAAVKISHN